MDRVTDSRSCKTCRWYELRETPVTTGLRIFGWWITKDESVLRDSLCRRFGPDGMPCDQARSRSAVIGWSPSPPAAPGGWQPIHQLVDGPCGSIGRMWEAR